MTDSSKRAYHIDRSDQLQENQKIELIKLVNITLSLLQKKHDERFSEGVSRHCIRYFSSSSSRDKVATHIYENLYEYERILHFQNSIYRFNLSLLHRQ